MAKLLLTGGCGFLGRFLVEELLSADSPLPIETLRVFDVSDYHGPSDSRIEVVKGNVCNQDALNEACKGMDIVVHAAAVVDWGTHPPSEVFRVNTGGTENVISACHREGVRILAFTSSLDAVLGGSALVDVDESIPYPDDPPNMYCKSKSEAEKLVIAANSPQLKTVILRPAEIWGEGDPFHIGSLVGMAKGGFYVRIGNGKGKSQHVYAGNMATAVIQAVSSLLHGNEKPAGQTYFITDGEPENFFLFYTRIVEAAGFRIWPKNLWIPRPLAYVIGASAELGALIMRPFMMINPKFSRFAVKYTCLDYTFKSHKAVRDFGFTPKYTEEQAFSRTVDYYRKMV